MYAYEDVNLNNCYLAEFLFKIVFCKIIFVIDIIIAIRKAIPKLWISKLSPISLSVISNVMALITNKNIPNVNMVIGKVKIINIGRTNTFKIDSIKLAVSAAPKLDTSKLWKNPAIATKSIALMNMLINHLIKNKTSF